MKKITLLLSLTLSVVLGYSQSVDFANQPNTSNDPTIYVESESQRAACTVSVPTNALENGLFLGGATNQRIAVDINVIAGETFTINEFIPTFIGAGTTFEVIIYDDAAGLPNTVLQTVVNADITVTSDVITGTNFGFDFHQIALSFNTPIVLTGGAAGTKYWLELQSDADGWETTTVTTEGDFLLFNNDNVANIWTPGTNECVYELVGDCTGGSPQCGGNYFDTGGDTGDYSASESVTTTITPDVAGEAVTVTFTYVDIEAATGAGNQDGCWDFLTVYDGPDTSSPVLAATLCGEESGDGSIPSVASSELNIGDSFTSSHASGALTFVFTSDSSVQETGWEADVTCAPVPLTCGDNYFDTGGSAGDYSNSEVETTTITPDVAGEVVTVTFTYVDIETSTGAGSQDGCWDFLTVYDGPDTSSPVLAATLCGEESGDGGAPSVAASELNVGDSFTSTHASGALTFVFTSDSSVAETGWEADITCAPAVSVSDLEVLGFNYYPNPVSNDLFLTARENITSVAIFNMLGQEVKSTTPSALETTINMSNLSTGTYFVKAQIGDAVGTFKIVKK